MNKKAFVHVQSALGASDWDNQGRQPAMFHNSPTSMRSS